MPSVKTFDKRSKTPTKTAAKAERDPKKSTKEIAIEQAELSGRDNVDSSKSLATIKSSKMHKSEVKVEEPFLEKALEKSDLEKIIEEIESKGSSSESEEFEEAKEETEPAVDLTAAEDDKLLDFDISSMERSISGEESDTERHGKVETEINFLDVFGKMPEVDEVSLDLLEEEKPQQPEKQPHAETVPSGVRDLGKFLDPVTGLSDLDIVSSAKSLSREILLDEESISGYKKETEEQMHEQPVNSTDDICREKSDEFELAGGAQQYQDDTFGIFLESVQPEDHQTKEEIQVDYQLLMQQQQKLLAEQLVTDFLQKLIDHCVKKAECDERDTVLRASLDKYKLICELKSISDMLDFERSRSQFLNKKTVIFFKRKGTFRPIIAEQSNALVTNRANFISCLNALDGWFIKEEKTRALNSSQISVLRQQYEEKKRESLEEVSKLEHLIRTTLQRKNFDKLHTIVERLIRKMSVVRKEIAEVRFKLLLEQHQFSTTKEKLTRLEDLGNGLNIRQYESLQTDTIAISKKIEEGNNTLEKLHRHLNDNLHKTAHAQEKQSILKNITVVQKQFLEEIKEKEQMLRRYIHDQKLRRNRLKHETNNLMHQAGLLSNQVLLKDYDHTVEKANKLKQTNEELRKTIEKLTSKIDEYK